MIKTMKQKTKNEKRTHTLIISDLHLGSRVSRPKAVARLLREFRFRKLILLGDVFESLNFEKLRKEDWELISLISEISNKKKVVWIEGNHDAGLANLFASFMGAKVYKVYRWRYRNKKYLAIHGHQFDNFLSNNFVISFLANQIYKAIQLVDFKDKRISRFIKKKSKGWLRLSKKVAQRAILYAKIQGVDYIFCGHTHKRKKKKSGSVHYYNSGCWTDVPSTYITLDKDDIQINKYF